MFPRLGDLTDLELVARILPGPLHFQAHGGLGARELTVELPQGCEGELVLPEGEKVALERAEGAAPRGHIRYRIPAATRVRLKLLRV